MWIGANITKRENFPPKYTKIYVGLTCTFLTTDLFLGNSPTSQEIAKHYREQLRKTDHVQVMKVLKATENFQSKGLAFVVFESQKCMFKVLSEWFQSKYKKIEII